jgi:2-polyprenyl-3-methyl-5-hydroxy-6-metoxy-1,4-benzoquinol methylase
MDSNLVENYGWDSPEETCSYAYISPAIIEELKELKVNRVLDLGSGNGKLCSEIYNQRSFTVVGVEYDRQGVEISKSSYPNIPFYNFGVQDDPKILLANESQFDAVVSTEVIEHLFSPHLLPIYAKNVLNDNGYLILTTPYHGYIKNFLLSLFNKWDSHINPLWHGGHIKLWSRLTLTKLLEQNGFKVVKFRGLGRTPYLWKSMLIIAQKTK